MIKILTFKSLGSIILGLLISSITCSAQVLFTFDTEVNGNTNIDDNDSNVAASGSGVFFAPFSDYDLSISITNDTYGPDMETAFLTGFYILAPWTSNVEEPAAEADLVNFSLATDGSNPVEWGNDSNFNNVLNEYNWPAPINNGNGAEYLYFGASTGSGSVGLDFEETGTFNFMLDDDSISALDVNWDAYFNSEFPHIFFRWQTIEDEFENEVFGGSAKGYGYFTENPGGIIIPVPEPSQIALMALLGMGGVLWIRKRIRRKSA